jgi:hypothetical protein
MKTFALVSDGTVVNVILWDGETPVDFGHLEAVECPHVTDEDGEIASLVEPGFQYVNEEFVDNRPQPETDVTDV